jgi:high-affinity iron transporter
MIESFLITSRETLEASLVIGIVLAYLNKTSNHQYKKSVYWGIAAGIFTSVLAAIGFTVLAGGFTGVAEELFEGITMLIGATLLTTMILWMLRQRHIAQEIQGRVAHHLSHQKPLLSYAGIFLLVFVAIIREGVETVIFLNATQYASGVNLIGGTLGIMVAIIIGYLFFIASYKVNLKILFNISSVLLILFAAGLVAHGVHELEEAAGTFIPAWDINPTVHKDGKFPALHEKGIIGSFAKGLFGYNGNPSLIEIISYAAYLFIISLLFLRIRASKVKSL